MEFLARRKYILKGEKTDFLFCILRGKGREVDFLCANCFGLMGCVEFSGVGL